MRWFTAGRRLLRTVLRVEVSGAAHVPADERVIFASNHRRRQVDPFVVTVAAPRRVVCISGADLRRKPLVWLAGRMGGVLYVTPDLPATSRFLRSCDHALGTGAALLIFPEGPAMGGGLGLFRHGAAYVALHAGASLQPVWIERCGWRRFQIAFGRPIRPGPMPMNRRSLETLTQELQAAILALRPSGAPAGAERRPS